MVGPPRGPPRPTMAPQTRATAPTQQPQQFYIKQVAATPYSMMGKPPAKNYVNYLSLPVMPGNGSFLAVGSKPGETNGTTFLTMPRPGYLVAKGNENNNTTFITVDPPLPPPSSAPPHVSVPSTANMAPKQPHAHQYLIPKPEPFALHNYTKHEPESVMRRKIPPGPVRPTNHQRIKIEIKEEEEEEGEEMKPILDPDRPILDQLVQIEHNYNMPPLPSPHDDDKESTISTDEKIEHGDDGEETETAAEGEDSVTRCICNMEHDDGYMICCDQCFVWQHVACVLPEISVANPLPDMNYLCDLCQPRTLDRNRARALQLQRRKQIMRRDDSSDDSWSSVDRSAPPPKKAVARRRAEPVQRRPNRKPDFGDGPTKIKQKVDPFEPPLRNRKSDALVDPPVKTKLLKPVNRKRDPAKGPLSAPLSQAATSVGRRTKLKRKFENKVNLRRKSKTITSPREPKVEKDEERRKQPSVELRPRTLAVERAPAKSRCRLTHSATGDPMVVTTCRVSRGESLTELRGKYLQSANAMPKPEVLFHYRFPKDGTEVILDASGKENIARYARRTCNPNSQLKHCLVKGSLQLYVVAMETLEKNQQVTIPHGSVTDNLNNSRECCGKDCVNNPKLSPNTAAVDKRRRSRRRTISEESDGSPVKGRDRVATGDDSPLSPTHSEKKLTREEKKIEQAMKIFAQMEKDTARKRDKERPGIGVRRMGDSDKESAAESTKSRRRRRRRRRRNSSRKSISSGAAPAIGSANSGEDSEMSSGDEFGSPRDKQDSKESADEDEDEKLVRMSDAADLLLALGGRRNSMLSSGRHTPPPVRDASENDSSPSTPLSSACLLVAAAVGPLAPGFKFPKTKKGMMNEWLGKSPEHVPSDFSPTTESGAPLPSPDILLPPGAPKLSNLSTRLYCPSRDALTGSSAGFGKKRWLRQAISEETEPSLGSPPCPPENITPLKKRRVARESMTSEPPTTPPLEQTPIHNMDDGIFGGESPVAYGTAGNDLAERVRSMQRDYMAAQGMDYDAESATYETAQQCVPENLTVPRPSSPPLSDGEDRPRRGRKRPANKAELRVSPRIRRKQKRPEKLDTSDRDAKQEVKTEDDRGVSDASVDSSPPVNCVKIEDSSEILVNKCLSDEVLDLHSRTECEKSESGGKETPLQDEREADVERRETPVIIAVEPPLPVENDCGAAEADVSSATNEAEESHCVSSKAEEEVDGASKFVAAEKLEAESSVEPPPAVPIPPCDIELPPVPPIEEVAPLPAEEISPPLPPDDAYDGPAPGESVESSKGYATEAGSEQGKTPTDVPEIESAEKSAPIKRKLSYTEYLKRKQISCKTVTSTNKSPEAKAQQPQRSPTSDDEISPLMLPTPTLPLPFLDCSNKESRFNVEPTELERQRENLNERLRREFGLMISDDEPAPIVEATNGFPEPKFSFPVVQTLPQSAIYPVGSSNPPNPYSPPPFPSPERRKFRK